MFIYKTYILIVLVYLTNVIKVNAEIRTFNFNVSYVTANPDGLFERKVIGINNHWPLPIIRVKKNDTVRIYLTNSLEDANTSLHFHGLFQKNSNTMDGPEMVTQCPIAPGFTFLYEFNVTQTGSYWYHSHSGSQYGDGMRGMFIIEDIDQEWDYDEDLTLSVGDWYHESTSTIMKKFLSRYNPSGAEPVPKSSLFNDTRNASIVTKPNTTYLLRIANIGIFASQYLFIENLNLTVVEADGVKVEPYETDSLYIAVGQRYTVLLHIDENADSIYKFYNVMHRDMFDVLPDDLQLISTNFLVLNNTEKPKPIEVSNKMYNQMINSIHPLDDTKLVPLSQKVLYSSYDYQIVLNFEMSNLGDGVVYALFNGKSYVPPKVPTLLTAISSGNLSTDARIYGSNTNSFVIQKDEIVEIVLNNNDPGLHPFHLHGHNFQIVHRSEAGSDESPVLYNPESFANLTLPEVPPVRDTVTVNENGYIVLRFKADNPGVWFFHCHVDWHLEQGLAITLIESPDLIQKFQKVPSNHWDACIASNTSAWGNAAGRHGTKEDWLNLDGQNQQPLPLPPGFTLKGYVALFICSIAAIFGIYTIYKYGIEDIKEADTISLLKKMNNILLQHDPSYHTEIEENSFAFTST